jgi:putative endonuclease
MKRQARGAAARRRGRRAETLAVWLLRFKGYAILARGLRQRPGEIDIVARRGGVVVFVEVKARPDQTSAADALRPRQRQRIARAAALFLARRPELTPRETRFDAILFAGLWPRHVRNAWDAPPDHGA